MDANPLMQIQKYGQSIWLDFIRRTRGGSNTGLYLLLTADAPQNLPVPGRHYSFGRLRLAQAIGDLQALQKRNRRVLRLHLGANVTESLNRIGLALDHALGETT